MMSRYALAFVLGLCVLVFVPDPAAAAGCSGGADWFHAHQKCNVAGTPGSLGANPTSSGLTHDYHHELQCPSGTPNGCQPTPCTTDGGEQGYEYTLYDGDTALADICRNTPVGEPPPPKPPTPGQVLTAARRYAWPEATLVIQPPDGETLVNFATNFYTTSTAPVTRTVHLVRGSATVEVTPQSYTWRFGDGSVETTTDPGAAYPELRITHKYLRKGQAAPQVDVTYGGRFHLGDGAWRTLPGTLTVAGTPQTLAILTATPHLVG